MPTPRASLWNTIPSSVRTQLVPILTTLFLVKAGQSTAELLVRLHEGRPFCGPGKVADPSACTPNSVAVADVQGILLLLNFVVILWFARLGLKEALEKPGEVKLDAKLVGLGTAFATGLELYDYATKAGVPERMVLALLVIPRAVGVVLLAPAVADPLALAQFGEDQGSAGLARGVGRGRLVFGPEARWAPRDGQPAGRC